MSRYQLAAAAAFILSVLSVNCKGGSRAATTQSSLPRLVVLVVVDQMRADELTGHQALWKHGFRRFVADGRIYTQAFVGHGRTDTASGHATLATGEPPRRHGVVSRSMVDTERGAVTHVCRYGAGGCSPDVLQVPTLGDRLKAEHPQAKVVALGQKDRAAMALGGKRGDLVAWYKAGTFSLDGRGAGWVFAPPAWLARFHDGSVSRANIARTWELPHLPMPLAAWPDEAPGEISCGHGTTFPHRLPHDGSDARLAYAWLCSPDSDRAVAQLALHAAEHMGLGNDDTPDLLAVTFGALDYVGHSFGYRSLERVAALAEIDRHIGDLLAGLRKLVGPRLLVALAADHGVGPKVAVARERGHPSGYVIQEPLLDAVETAVAATLGQGAEAAGAKHAVAFAYPFLGLGPVPEAKRKQAIAAAVAALRAYPGVYGAWPTESLKDAPDPIARLLYESAYPSRSGDVAFALKPYHYLSSLRRPKGGGDHGTPWPYDRHVPVALWGYGVRPGQVEHRVAVRSLIRTLGDRLRLPPPASAAAPLP